jgi:hypothetical protein
LQKLLPGNCRSCQIERTIVRQYQQTFCLSWEFLFRQYTRHCHHALQAACHYLGRSAHLPDAIPKWNLKENIVEDLTPFLPLSPPFVPYAYCQLGTILSGIERPSLINLLYVFENTYDIFRKKTKVDGPGPPTSGAWHGNRP